MSTLEHPNDDDNDGANTLAKQMAKLTHTPTMPPATQSGGSDTQQPSDGDTSSNGGPTIIDVVKTAGYAGDDGLFWEKAKLLDWAMGGREVGVTEETGQKGWRRIRTMRFRYLFRCVGFTPEHRCPLPRAAQMNDVPWLDPDDAGLAPGDAQYEQWHLGTTRTVVMEIEASRADELVVPVRGQKVTTGHLMALEAQWRGAPPRLPNN